MRKRRYQIILFLWIGLFLTAGCGKADGANTDGGQQGVQSGFDHTNAGQEAAENGGNRNAVSWQARYYQMADRYDFVLSADRLYGCVIRDRQVVIDVYNVRDINDGKDVSDGKDVNAEKDHNDNGAINDQQELYVEQTLTVPGVSSVLGMAADQEGNAYFMGRKEDRKEESAGLWRIDAEGQLSDYAELKLEDTEAAEDFSLKGICTDSDGTLFIWCKMLVEEEESGAWHWEDRVYVKDAQWNTLFCEKIADMGGTEVLSFQLGTDGSPFFIVRDLDGGYLQEIDVAQKGLKDAVRLEKAGEVFDAGYGNGMEQTAPSEDGFLYCRDNGLFLFRINEQKTEKLLSLSTYGIFSADILFLKKDGDVIEIIDSPEGSGNQEFVSFTLGENEKKTVTLGSTSMLPYLERVVAEFNRYSGEYRVEIVDYIAQKGNYEDAAEQLKLDVISGKAPDIITVTGTDYRVFAEKGALADLYDFMEGDEECSREMLVRSVAEAYEDRGHLYRISPSFQLHSMWGYGDVTGGQGGVTFEELFQMLENSGKDINAIAGFSADEPVLTRLCTVSMEEFIDWENGTCSFDGDYFKKALSFAGEYTGPGPGDPYSERIRSRETVLSVGIISDVTDYQLQKELYGGNVSFVGYPVAEGSGTAVAFRADAVAVNAGKEDLTGAWAFVKFYLLHGYDGQGFPILREQFDQVLDAAMVEDDIVSEDGQEEKYPKEYYYDGGRGIFLYAATQEDVDAVRRLVESAGTRCEVNSTIQNIIDEEAAGYFSGQIDLDSTVKKIQNRVQLYLDEGRQG
ncbi:MAG: extracellular solute-binding protein [bacterium]|nr:extracellular solute-binding protein [bacterium]